VQARRQRVKLLDNLGYLSVDRARGEISAVRLEIIQLSGDLTYLSGDRVLHCVGIGHGEIVLMRHGTAVDVLHL